MFTKKSKQLIELYVNDTLDITYRYLRRVLTQYGLEMPLECRTYEKYIETLTNYKKMIRGNKK